MTPPQGLQACWRQGMLHGILAVSAFGMAGGQVWAQGAAAAAAPAALAATSAEPQSFQTDRDRINGERRAADAQYDKVVALCEKRFLVTPCVNEAKAQRRTVKDDLQRQEVNVDDRERRARASDAVTRVAERNSAAEQQTRAVKSQRAVSDDAQRQARAKERAEQTAERERAAAAKQARTPTPSPEQSIVKKLQDRSQVEQGAAQKALAAQAREREYAQRKADKAQRLSQKTSLPAAPLPDTPVPPIKQ